MPLGPKRAPGRYEVPVSKGAPMALLGYSFPRAACSLTNECNVKVRVGRQARTVWEAAERGDAREYGIRLNNCHLCFLAKQFKSKYIPEHRRLQGVCCTTSLRGAHSAALGRDHDRHEQQQQQRS